VTIERIHEVQAVICHRFLLNLWAHAPDMMAPDSIPIVNGIQFVRTAKPL
jgi:hypothetical protein